MKEKTCCFTGHREIPSGQRRRIFAKTEEAIEGLIKKAIYILELEVHWALIQSLPLRFSN